MCVVFLFFCFLVTHWLSDSCFFLFFCSAPYLSRGGGGFFFACMDFEGGLMSHSPSAFFVVVVVKWR